MAFDRRVPTQRPQWIVAGCESEAGEDRASHKIAESVEREAERYAERRFGAVVRDTDDHRRRLADAVASLRRRLSADPASDGAPERVESPAADRWDCSQVDS